jgi:biotin carboxylase
VVEVAARLGGGHDAELVRAVTGVDLNGLAIDAALGRETPTLEPAPQVGGACVRFLVAPPGALRELQGLEEAAALEGVEWVRVYREPGTSFAPLRRGADRAGAVLATGRSREEAVARAGQAATLIRFDTAEAEALV